MLCSHIELGTQPASSIICSNAFLFTYMVAKEKSYFFSHRRKFIYFFNLRDICHNVDANFCPTLSHSCLVPKNHTEAYIKYKLFSLLAQAYY